MARGPPSRAGAAMGAGAEPSLEDLVSQLAARHQDLGDVVRSLRARLDAQEAAHGREAGDGAGASKSTIDFDSNFSRQVTPESDFDQRPSRRPSKGDRDRPSVRPSRLHSQFSVRSTIGGGSSKAMPTPGEEKDWTPNPARSSERSCVLFGEWRDGTGEFFNGSLIIVDHRGWIPVREGGAPDEQRYATEGNGNTFLELQLQHTNGKVQRFMMRPGPVVTGPDGLHCTAIVHSQESGKRYELTSTSDKNKKIKDQALFVAAHESQLGPTEKKSFKRHARLLVLHPAFDHGCVVAILIDAVLFGITVTNESLTLQRNDFPVIETCQQVLTFLFAIELAVRMYSLGRQFFTDENDLGWNMLDAVVVPATIAEVLINKFVEASAVMIRFSNFRMLRCLRLVRLIRYLRVLRCFKELRVMVYSVICSPKPLTWAGTLLMFMLYMFSLFFVQVSTEYRRSAEPDEERESELLAKYFGSPMKGMYTLFWSVTGGDWNLVSEALQEAHWSLGVCMVLYVSFMVLAIMNIITAIFVEGAVAAAQADREAKVQDEVALEKTMRNELTQLFRMVDSGGNGVIDIREFLQAVEKEEVQAFFRLVAIEIGDPWDFFKLLDQDNDNKVSLAEFISGCEDVSGSAQKIDLVLRMAELKRSIDDVHCTILDVDMLSPALGASSRRSRRSRTAEGPPRQDLAVSNEHSALPVSESRSGWGLDRVSETRV